MKHVFECGVTGESNGSPAGDAFLAQMVATERDDLLPRGELPKDFTIEIHQCDWMRAPSPAVFQAKVEALMQYMIDRGYECLRWTEHDKYCDCIRFRKEVA